MMGDTETASPLMSWPDASHRRRLFAAAIWLSLLFVVVYGTTDYITAMRSTRFPIHFAFELTLPFVPQLSVVYSSVYLMFAFVALAMSSAERLGVFVGKMTWMTLVAGVCFLAYPSELAFQVPEVVGWSKLPFWWADLVNLTYNCAPSLHVGYAVLCAETMRRHHRSIGVAFHLWALAIALSAWLTYQHHLLDLLSGALLALVVAAVSRRLTPA